MSGESSVEDAPTLAASIAPPAKARRPDTSAAPDDRYDLGPVLGRGGMGEVRLAHDVRIDRDVAVKLMHANQRDDATIARFFREARVQGGLEHPAVVPVHDLGLDADGNPFFVMKRVTGATLLAVLGTTDPDVRARWPRRTLLARFVDVCLAVEFAHTRGVVHRDLKPANIMLGDFGEVHVIDWGLARVRDDSTDASGPARVGTDDREYHTVAGALLGTPGYMSPEQVRSDPVTAASDVYALGCILYELVAGAAALPHGMDALEATLNAPHLRPSTAKPEHAAVPPELDDACAHATAAIPTARPTARGLADAVQAYLDGDRDVARRSELAAQHVAAARTALAEPGDEARARAMHEAGRALALDPSNADAAALAARLLLDAPAALPAEARVASDRARAHLAQGLMRWITASYVFIAAVIATMFVYPIRNATPFVALIGCCAAAAGVALYGSRRLLPMRSWVYHMLPWLNAGALAAGCECFGPFLVIPVFLIGTLSAGISLPTRMPPPAMVIPTLLGLVVPLLLEVTGVTPASFHIDAKGLVLNPWAIELSPAAMMFLVLLGTASMAAITIILCARQRAAQQATEDRLHATTWHLEQLLPKRDDQVRERPAR